MKPPSTYGTLDTGDPDPETHAHLLLARMARDLEPLRRMARSRHDGGRGLDRRGDRPVSPRLQPHARRGDTPSPAAVA